MLCQVTFIFALVELLSKVLPASWKINVSLIKLLPLSKLVSSQDEAIKLQLLLFQVFKAILNGVLHNVEKDVVRICILEAFTD